jgi:hypothetical protein
MKHPLTRERIKEKGLKPCRSGLSRSIKVLEIGKIKKTDAKRSKFRE